ncbi:MAG: hypothetical protein IKP77_00655 [Acholeplasmatales bacterium]|nr:hypothetical protein [Acholeplasmatales bacterium]
MESKSISEIIKEISDLNIPLKEKITKGIIAFLLSFGLVFGPIVFCVNMLIYQKLRGLLAFSIVLLTVLFSFLTLKIYYESTVRKRVKDINKLVIIPTFIVFFIGLLVVGLLYFMKVI